ncbi:MAG: 50S ribosomal protein L37ae [Nanoarchaeota archaeon]|nr:50S ribosomal protein L37ae [Nanoarchaeota archaeon]
MAVPKAIASIKRFGARYGRTVKNKFGKVEAMHRKKYKCPYCSKQSVRRLSAGIWQCTKCNAKIASRAYTVAKKKTAKELISAVDKAPEETVEETDSEDYTSEKSNSDEDNQSA